MHDTYLVYISQVAEDNENVELSGLELCGHRRGQPSGQSLDWKEVGVFPFPLTYHGRIPVFS